MSSKKTRIDLLLVKRGLAESRQKAQALILSGKVFYSMDGLNFHPVLKPGEAFPESVILQIKEDIPYVSRGGLKLEGPLRSLR